MSKKVIPIRGSVEEKAQWDLAAGQAGLSFSAWARRALNEVAASDLVEVAERESESLRRARMIAASSPGVGLAGVLAERSSFRPDPK